MNNIKRDNYWAMMKDGRFRALRNLPVGWVLQIVHSTDTTERWFRIISELLILCFSYILINKLNFFSNEIYCFIVVFIVVHTLSWFFVGNFWVYMLDSFKWVKNPGINDTIKYINLVDRVYKKINCCEAILIYGSMCRNSFHIRSDLDLRIIRRTDSLKGFLAIPIGFSLRFYAFFIKMPVDFQVVDSLGFVNKQMRDDEYPIVVEKSSSFLIVNSGPTFDSVIKNPTSVLKK